MTMEKKNWLEKIDELSETPEMREVERKWVERMNNPLKVEGYTLKCVCGACPEAYDVFDEEGSQVGYLRLRHGWFRADYPVANGEIVYESRPNGDGVFEEGERMEEITKAVRAIRERSER